MKKLRTRIMAAALAVTAASLMLTSCGDGKTDGTEIADSTESAAEVSGNEDAAPLSADDGKYVNPDWSYGQVEISGGGFVTGIISTSEENLFYARTDVGGAYRWDNGKQKWIALGYDITEEDVGLLGIDGIACDPNNPAKLYLAAGTEYFSNGKTCILVSEDYGDHFKQIDVTDLIKVHGNGMGRGNGERIAVDPNDGNIIFCGGRTGGMIKSTDGGMTWEAVSSFPVTKTDNSNGINGILFDPSTGSQGSATQRIYASVSQRDDANLYVSEDGGESWNPVPDAITKYMPQRMKLDSQGRLYVVYANNEGPWNAMTGALYRYDTANGKAEEIAVPIPNSLGDIAISPEDDNKLVLVTSEVWEQQPNGAFGDKFFTSTDGGATWKDVSENWSFDANGMNWIANSAMHWCSSLAMDPYNDNKIMVNSGNGIFACDNIFEDAPAFYFNAKGIEEVVPLDIVSLPGHALVTAIGDFDGFVHEDIFSAPERHTEQIGTTNGIAIAAKNTDVWVKTGGNDNDGQKLLYTEDDGKSWKYITKKPDDSKKNYGGKVGLTCDGNTIFWSPENGTYVYYTTDRGETWNQCEGVIGSNLYIAGDPVNPDYVYMCSNSTVYVSSDGGKSFKKTYEAMGSVQRITVAPDKEGAFYIPGGALFYTEDHGQSFTMVEGLKQCSAVGLGKPKNDGDPYVIYAYGTPKDSDITGIYMSEDQGGSWTRVNDDLHNFGGTGNGHFVSGDMNVYGRCYMSTVGLGLAYCDKNEK